MGTKVWEGEVRDAGQVLDGFGRVDYSDCYVFEMPENIGVEGKDARLDAVAMEVFGRMPGIVEALLRLRNAIVTPLGLKTDWPEPPGQEPEDGFESGGRIGTMPVLARGNGEIILGEDDRHLDFRVAIHLEKNGEGRELIAISTWVHFHNWLGRAYFLFVGPLHRLIVKIVAANAIKGLERMGCK